MNAATEGKSVIELPASGYTRREERDLPMVQANPMAMLASAVARGMDPSVLKDLMDLQERHERNEARKAYADALAAFKANAPTVVKDKTNVQYDSRYAGIGNIVNTVNPELSKYGLSARWDIDQSNGIQVACILTHRAGHSERVSMKGPADDSGKKNPLQQIKSTVTYLKIATFEAVTGIAASDGGDDDGNGAPLGLSETQVADFGAAIDALTTRAEADDLWATIVASCEAAGDIPNYEALKKALLAKSKAFPKGEK